jgi:lysophospholipase L1-like esterase
MRLTADVVPYHLSYLLSLTSLPCLPVSSSGDSKSRILLQGHLCKTRVIPTSHAAPLVTSVNCFTNKTRLCLPRKLGCCLPASFYQRLPRPSTFHHLYLFPCLHPLTFIKMVRVVNLGSSFSAGPGIPPQINAAAGRSGVNFAHLLSKDLNAQLTDLSVSGATLLNITETPQVSNGETFPPQIQGVPNDADIVLVLGGGNDMSYIGSLFMEHTWMMTAFSVLNRLKGVAAPAMPSPADEEEVVQRFGKVLDAVHAKAPQARVIVVEYLTLLGADTKALVDVPFNTERLEHHQGVAAKLQSATSKVVDSRKGWCERIPMAELSQGHGIGSAEPWVFGCTAMEQLTGKTWYHPNGEGMKAVAKALYEHINKR